MPLVSVIVPVRDASATLPRTLDALAAQETTFAFEVIVVDDGSRDGSAMIARTHASRPTVLCQPANGPATARNRGTADARGSLLAFCDADVFPTPGWLAAGVAALASHDLVQGRVDPDPTVPLGPFDRTVWIDRANRLWETANLFVTRSMFDRVGGFEEWIRPRHGKALAEDVWFGYRALRAGARPGYAPGALAHHAVFRRRWFEPAAERARLRFFGAMVAKMPELRSTFLHRRLFLDRRSFRFDLALAGLTLAARTRRSLPLALAVPYAELAHGHARRAGASRMRAAAVAAADLAADVVGAGALLYGSVRYRALVL